MPITVGHVLTATTPDNPTFEIKPSNWNSSHAVTLNAVGSEISGAFSNTNGVSFGLETNGRVTASVETNYLTTARASNDAIGLNTAQSNVTWTVGSAGLSVDARGYAGTGTSVTGGAAVTLNSNGLQFNGASIAGTTSGFTGANISASITHDTAGLALSMSVAAGGGGNFSAGASNLGNTAGDTGVTGSRIVFAGGNNITLSQATDANGATITVSGANAGGAQTGISGIAASNATYTSGSVTFRDGNGISWATTTGQQISVTHDLQYTSNTSNITSNALHTSVGRIAALYDGANSISTGTVRYTNANGVSFSINGQTISASVNTSYRASNDAIGLNTAQSNVTWTVNSSGLSLDARGYAGTGTSATNASVTLNSNGLAISVAAPGGAASQTVYAAGNTTVNSSGTMPLSSLQMRGYGIVSLGTSNGSLLISTPDPVDFTQLSIGNSNLGNTAGDTGVFTGRVVFVGSNNITLSGSSNGGSATLSIIGGAGGGGGIANAAGTQTATSGTVVFSNSNGITFGMSNSSVVTASYNSTQFAGQGTTFAGANISASMTLNSNGLNLSASVAAPGAAAEANAINLLGANTAGNTTASGSTIGYSGINLTLSGTNGSIVNISAPAVSSLSAGAGLSVSTNGSTISLLLQTRSGYDPYGPGAEVVYSNQGQGTLAIAPVDNVQNFQFDRIVIPVQVSNASNSSFSATHSWWVGIYSQNASTLSLVQSTSTSHGFTASGTAGSYSLWGGPRLMTIPLTTTLTRGDYWVGIVNRTTTGGGAGMTINQGLASQPNSNHSGIYGAASNATIQSRLGLGVYTASTSGMPGSIGFSQINGTGSLALRAPMFYFTSGTV